MNRTASVHKAPVTWILVADGKQAHVYVRRPVERKIRMSGANTRHAHYNTRHLHELAVVPGMEWQAESPAEFEFGRRDLGRVFESADSARHIAEPHADIGEEIRYRFMRGVAQHLNEARVHRRFDRLVLAAPPKCLGVLRTHLDRDVLGVVIAEMAKDLTHCENGTLEKHLNNIA